MQRGPQTVGMLRKQLIGILMRLPDDDAIPIDLSVKWAVGLHRQGFPAGAFEVEVTAKDVPVRDTLQRIRDSS